MDTYLALRLRRLVPAVAFSLLVALSFVPSSHAQGLAAKETIDAIVDAEVKTTDEAAAAPEQRVIAAIEKSRDNAAEIRKRVSIDNLEIVLLHGFGADCAMSEARRAITAKMEDYADDLAALREAIQGSAIFYHAVDSQSVLLNDVIAVDFGDEDDVMVVVATTQCEQQPKAP